MNWWLQLVAYHPKNIFKTTSCFRILLWMKNQLDTWCTLPWKKCWFDLDGRALKPINKHFYQYFDIGKAAEALGERRLCNDHFPNQIASFVQTKNMDAFSSQHGFNILRSTSFAKCTSKDADMTAEDNFVQEPSAQMRFVCSDEEIGYHGKSHRACHRIENLKT